MIKTQVYYLCKRGHMFAREVSAPHHIRACRGDVLNGMCLVEARPMSDVEVAAYMLGGPKAVSWLPEG